MHVSNNDVILFDSSGVEHISKETKTFISNKNIKTNMFRIQAYDSIICDYFCIGLIIFMLADKSLTDFTNIFYQIIKKKQKNNDIFLNYFYN